MLASDGALTGAAGRRRALALLALIACARDDGLARDRAFALLWPELDSERARNNLKQLVFSLRRALTPDVFAATGASLRLDPNVITVDLWAYEKAIADAALENAVARYGGPFLDGFSIPGLPEFERWVEAERERLACVHAQTLDTLGEQARRGGHFEIAVAWRRHLAALDPLSSRYAVSFVRALADAGDIPGALRHAHLFERLVRSELDADVGPEMRLVVAQLRLRVDATMARAITSDEIAILTAETRAAAAATRAVDADTAISAESTAGPERPSRWGRTVRALRGALPAVSIRRIAVMSLAVAIVVVLGFAGRTRFLSPSAAMGEVAPDLPATVAVFAFAGRAGTLTGELGRATAELLSTSLDGGTGLTAIAAPADEQPSIRATSGDSVVVDRASAAHKAEHLGARLFVVGRIVEVGGRLRVTATIHDRARIEPPLARAIAEGPANEMFEVVDHVAAQLLAGRFPGSRGALAQVAAVTAKSLPAAKAYYTAEQQLGMGRFSAAVDALRDAVRIDSGFAIAYYRMSRAAELLGDDAETRSAAAGAVRFSNRLDDRYRRLVAAASARQTGDVAAADRAYARLTLDYPDDAEAWLGLGESLFHLNATRGRPVEEARDAFIRVVELDPRSVEALVHLARIDALRGDSTAVDDWMRRARALATDDVIGRLALHVRALGGALAAGGVDRQRLQRAGTLHRGPGAREILTGKGPRAAERFATQFLAPDVPADVAAFGHRLAAYAASARGRYGDALRHLDESKESDADSDIDVRSLIVISAGVPLDSEVVRQTRIAVERWEPAYLRDPDRSFDAIANDRDYALLRLHRLGLLALREGDRAGAARVVARLESAGAADPAAAPAAAALSLGLRARLAAAAGDSAGALTLLEQVRSVPAGHSATAEPLDRLLRADLLAAAGRYAEAVRWYSTLGTGAPQELPLVGRAALGMARASERLGDRAAAVHEYRRVVELWRGADAALQPTVAAAERRAVELSAAPR